MSRKITILVGLLLVALFVTGIIWFVGFAFEPVDPLSRAQRTVRCANNSSVVLYERKTGWFTSETELSVRFFDSAGRVVRRDGLGTFPRWNDSEMKVLETPDVYCDKVYWTKSSVQWTQPNKSLHARRESVFVINFD